jgi:hypothetical protein
MNGITEWTIPLKDNKVKSLCWQDDTLIDWAMGGITYHLDATSTRMRWGIGYRFDGAIISPSGDYVVVYEKLGTKGIVLYRENLIREINRSYAAADVYEYPIALFQLPDGREVIAHCPEHHHEIHIDDLETGKRLTESPTRKSFGWYHSRFSATNNGAYLLNAGWVWHPWDMCEVYDVTKALQTPETLDGWGLNFPYHCEVASAAFLGNDSVIFTGSPDSEEDDEALNLHPNSIALFDLKTQNCLSSVKLTEPAGTLMPLSDDYVVGFYEHPKLIALKSGKIIYRWTEINSGMQLSSIVERDSSLPTIALDTKNRRFAVASDEVIYVVQIDPTQLPTTYQAASPPTDV